MPLKETVDDGRAVQAGTSRWRIGRACRGSTVSDLPLRRKILRSATKKCHAKWLDSLHKQNQFMKEGFRERKQCRTRCRPSGGSLADRGHRSCRVTALHSRLTRVHGITPLAERSRSGARGVSHQFGSRSEGTGSPWNHGAGSVPLRAELWLQATSITSILTSVRGYSFSNTRIRKACALITTTCISNKRSAAIPPTHPQSG